MTAPPLNLMPPAQYRAERAHVFKSDESLRWFIRQHHDELVNMGALVAPTGRKLIFPEAFDLAVCAIGGRMAATRGGRGAKS